MAKVNVSIPDDLLRDVDALAEELQQSRSGLVAEATATYVMQVRAEQAAEERRRRISAAIAEMREIGKLVPDGPDATEIIREGRDTDWGRWPAE
jgi:metal-responsive CopG/Arc/MetJ family transcriptional regulator